MVQLIRGVAVRRDHSSLSFHSLCKFLSTFLLLVFVNGSVP